GAHAVGPRCSSSSGAGMWLARAFAEERRDDSQAEVGRVSLVLEEEESEDGQAKEPGHVRDAGGSRETRARRAVLQTPRLGSARAGARAGVAPNPRIPATSTARPVTGRPWPRRRRTWYYCCRCVPQVRASPSR